ncbi:hypothetical protein CEP51_013046 [Fusarium floridanum]|uniref:Uncharacterized protein n=2 Tax=Fusarium solani species complex TaxID=232080 RepID=A0A428QIG4_9HYPO|nr:hypothetical protein CEP51_013046 [Fusarium floridanum]RSM17731.1 hypothetical protein CDV31_003501 [Fusarium ambrosium]
MGLLSYKWMHPKRKWTCASRKIEENNENVLVKLRIPFIKWPRYEEEVGRENLIPGPVIYERGVDAIDNWAPFLRENADGEEFTFHEGLTCIIQMHETLMHTICTLPTECQYLRLFYGAAADRVRELGEVTRVKLHVELPKLVELEPDGRFKIMDWPGYKVRLG